MGSEKKLSKLSQPASARRETASSSRVIEPLRPFIRVTRSSWMCTKRSATVVRFRRCRPVTRVNRSSWVCTKEKKSTVLRFHRRRIVEATPSPWKCAKRNRTTMRFRRRPTLDEVANAHSQLRHARINQAVEEARKRHQRRHRKMQKFYARARAISRPAPSNESASEAPQSKTLESVPDQPLAVTAGWYKQVPILDDSDFEDFKNTGRNRTEPPIEDDIPFHLATYMCMGDAYSGSMLLDLFGGRLSHFSRFSH